MILIMLLHLRVVISVTCLVLIAMNRLVRCEEVLVSYESEPQLFAG